jgi:hypothetical protein
MTEIIRHCPDCGRSRLFAPHHDLAGRCPDSPDQSCPEWLCVDCGATLLIGAILPVPEPTRAVTTGRRDRVA